MDYPVLILVIFLMDKPADTLWIEPVKKSIQNVANTFNILAQSKGQIMVMEIGLLS